jgi:4-hydroxy-3-methylbut-2-enyl diphosphate reductase IspH
MGSTMGSTIKIKKDLWTKVKKIAAAAGYSSPEEFVEHVLEREVAKLDNAQSDEEIVRRLKGLGYID